MKIQTAQWANKEQTAILVNGNTTVPWPCQTWHKGVIDDWMAEGNEIAPVSPPTDEQIQAEIVSAVQTHMDSKARERGYDNVLSLCTYATSTNTQFAAEGQAGVEWRDAVWALCYQILADVNAGTRPVPTVKEVLGELPAFVWP